ncbi:MAG TPA: hypothetical protein VGF48_11485 [Thermoanaerobaculia bacterium]
MKHSSGEREYSYASELDEPSISVARIIHTLRGYVPTILLTLAAVAVGYAIFATAKYLMTPSQRVTTQMFRLEFKGAQSGEYPNGVKFSPAEILTTPVLLRVYNDNELQRFISFPVFTRSLFIAESNPEYERVLSEYRSRLADPKLTPVDRDRIVTEFESKRASLSKGDLAIQFVRLSQSREMPEVVVRKVLSDVLAAWSNRAVREQRVTQHRISVLSPDVVNPTALEQSEPLAAIHVLRLKIVRVINDLNDLDRVAGAELARTPNGALSIEEIRTRLEEIIRFRLEPLVTIASVNDPGAARRFMEAQLAYDQRVLAARRQSVEAVRQAINAYAMQNGASPNDLVPPSGQQPSSNISPSVGNVSPVISEGFLDRLVALANQSTDIEYRQSMISELRMAAEYVIPAENAVAYDEALLRSIGTAPSNTAAAQSVREQIEQSRKEVRQLITNVNELHRVLSATLNPSTQLYSLTGVSTTTIERGSNVSRLLGIGFLLLLLTLPVTVALCLVHSKVRAEEEELAEESLAATAAGSTTG